MKEIIAGVNESGQRLDKLLHKYLSQAGSGFIYKMLRKKNIVLNDKKAGGKEILSPGDSIKLYLSDETLTLMTGRSITSGNEHSKDHSADKAVKASKSENDKKAKKTRNSKLPNLPKHCIVYEDANLLVINKPAGWLSQSDGSKAPSANEICLNYLIRKGELTESQMETFKPGIANRLDRNTSGLLLFGKTLPALQELGKILKDRSLKKYYLTVVSGVISSEHQIDGFLYKNPVNNKVEIRLEPFKDASEIHTAYQPLESNGAWTVLKVHLITGKTHQIRAHLASIGHPILGDPKYGKSRINEICRKKYKVEHQLLHAWQLCFPGMSGVLAGLSGKTLVAEYPDDLKQFYHR